MKKNILLILTFMVLILLSTINISKAYSKDSTLYYDGNKKVLTYFNVKDKDLFSDFKNLMPGDKRTQTIVVEADNVNSNTEIYLRLNDNYEYLDYLDIRLYKNDEEIYRFKDKKEMIKIHTFHNNEKILLKLTLNVPKDLENEIEDAVSNLNFEFVIQEDGKISVPKTYDSSNIFLNLSVMIISLFMIIILILKIKKLNKS